MTRLQNNKQSVTLRCFWQSQPKATKGTRYRIFTASSCTKNTSFSTLSLRRSTREKRIFKSTPDGLCTVAVLQGVFVSKLTLAAAGNVQRVYPKLGSSEMIAERGAPRTSVRTHSRGKLKKMVSVLSLAMSMI